MNSKITRLTIADDLQAIVDSINAATWDDENDMGGWEADDLRAYLERQDTVFICHFGETVNGWQLMGIGSARIEIKPYDRFKWLYVDEVDVSSSHRQKGVGSALMKFFLEIARESGCQELWLGAEKSSVAANALYRSLSADDVDEVIGYNFVIRS